MEVNQRVYVKSENAYGYFVGIKDEYRRVTLDGNDVSDLYNVEDVVPVEVVVLEGKVWAPSVDGVNYALVGDYTVVGALTAMHGDVVRLTIERVKKEG